VYLGVVTMHGDKRLFEDDFEHHELVHKGSESDDDDDFHPPIGKCFCCRCRSSWCTREVEATLRCLSWISGLIWYCAGAYRGGKFRRRVYSDIISPILQWSVVNPPHIDGVKIKISEHVPPGEVSTLVFEREDALASKKPIFLFVHGGGFCIGDPKEKFFFDFCKYLALQGFLVVSPAYRLAPENPFPASVEDCFDVLHFISGTDDLLANGDKSKVILGGDSAGANLALVLATLFRDKLNAQLDSEDLSAQIDIKYLVLMYPTMMLPYPTKSAIEHSDAVLLPHW